MKTRVLARVYREDSEWVAVAYHAESAFCSVRGLSEDAAVEKLKAEVERVITVEGRAWLEKCKHGGTATAPNCPEGAVRLPADLWVCKLVDRACPIQAQVFLDDPERFFSHCLAPRNRSEQIFDTVSKGRYDGFHHLPGRFLCVWCQHGGRSAAFQYYYPWELTHVEAYYPFELKRDWPRLHRRLRSMGAGLSEVSNALCAAHCMQLAGQLDPAIAAALRSLEFEISR